MILSQIVATSENKAIGKDNQLLWHHSEDLKYFKQQTSGKILIMGRKTFESLGRPLPKRFHIVISRNPSAFEHEMVRFVNTIEAAYELAAQLTASGQWPEEVMICGGAEIYRQTQSDCQHLYITRIPGDYPADAFYDETSLNKFSKVLSKPGIENPNLIFEVWSKNQIIV